jgi:succinate dehydrogenase / fumarate reductase cytochrome b subunit
MPTNGKTGARFQSKWMIFHGSMLLVFIILHLITFKYGPHYDVTYDGVKMRNLHQLVIEVFQTPGYVAWYVVSMVILGLHLSHGFYSSFASLGFYHAKFSPLLSKFGYVYAVIIALGFMAQPLYVYLVVR